MKTKQLKIDSIKKQSHFHIINKKGEKIFSRYFIIVKKHNLNELGQDLVQDNKDDKNYLTMLLGLKISKKISKKAVVRNKIRRRIKHLIRLASHTNPQELANTAFIIIPKFDISNILFKSLEKDFKKIIFYS